MNCTVCPMQLPFSLYIELQLTGLTAQFVDKLPRTVIVFSIKVANSCELSTNLNWIE